MMDYSRYPRTWKQISLFIRSYRAEWRCEWCGAEQSKPNPRTGSKVMLTVHHIGIAKPDGSRGDPHDKKDCRLANLVALCQQCHLQADMETHIKNRRANKRRAEIRNGQMELMK